MHRGVEFCGESEDHEALFAEEAEQPNVSKQARHWSLYFILRPQDSERPETEVWLVS